MDYTDLLQNVFYYLLCNFDIVLLQGMVCKYFSCCLWIPLSVITKSPASLLRQLLNALLLFVLHQHNFLTLGRSSVNEIQVNLFKNNMVDG